MDKKTIRAFRKTLRRFDRINEILNNNCCRSVTLAQCHVLLEIEEIGDATTNQLAKNLKLDKSTLSRTVDGLVRKGLVKRSIDDMDRRYTNLSLTELGLETCKEINYENDKVYRQLIQKFKENNRDQIIENFYQLVQTMEELYGNDECKCCK